MTIRKSMTYGTLPSREEFDAAFDAQFDDGNVGTFGFKNDPRVGSRELTASELWAELVKAQKEWADPHLSNRALMDEAGQWCSDVLGILGV